MNIGTRVLAQGRLLAVVVLMLSVLGAAAWVGMDRQEDPAFPYRYGQILVEWPGADAERVRRLVLKAIEEDLASIEEIREIRATARLGVAHLIIGMHQEVYATDGVWERVRMAMQRSAQRLPDGAGPIRIDDRSMDTHGIVLALSGSEDLLELLDAARALRRELFTVAGLARIELLADPGEALELSVDTAALLALGMDLPMLAGQIEAGNRLRSSGSLLSGSRTLLLRADGELTDLEALAALSIRTPAGDVFPLSELAQLRLRPDEPGRARMWVDGRPAVGLGIVLPDRGINAVKVGRQLRERLAALEAEFAPLQIEEMFYQPYWVEKRLAELGRSLLWGVGIVAAVLLLSMGLRMGLLVAALLPLVTLSSLAVFALGGGVLHQMAVAGMVIALGMLVDNAIVMVENLQWHLDRGLERAAACQRALSELAAPLAAATGTTLAAFTPLLLAPGDTPDFTRAIPVMVMLVLLVSYLYAVSVTPALASRFLVRAQGSAPSRGFSEDLGRRLGQWAVAAPGRVLGASVVLLLLALASSGWMQRDFFPSTDRNQLLVDLSFAEGTRIEHTQQAAAVLAAELRALPSVQSVHQFVGFSGPRFYYNLIETPQASHLARLVVNTQSVEQLPALQAWVREHLPARVPDAQLVARRLGQGPPVTAPVEIRVFGATPAALASVSAEVMRELQRTPGAVDVRHSLGNGLPTLYFDIDDAEAARQGVPRSAIAEALAAATAGQQASTWRAGREPIPMVLRESLGEQLPAHALEGVLLRSDEGLVPLERFVRPRLGFQPAVIEHRDLRRMTAVLAETDDGYTYDQVLAMVMPRLLALDLPEGVQLQAGGSAAEADSANSALFGALPIGALLLLLCLMGQFNSLRRVGIVLLTVPLAAIGVIPGLILAGQPFSFTATLGVLALVGIVVNNAIVLIDRIDRERSAGLPGDEAVIQAVARRTRPILLTTATTIGGLLPLTMTRSTLWPPMAWAIIAGLLVSSLLTLVVIPAVYRLVLLGGKRSPQSEPDAGAAPAPGMV